MGQHPDPPVSGSRRAAVLTLTASALLVTGGVVILRSADDVHLAPPAPPRTSLTPSSVVGEPQSRR